MAAVVAPPPLPTASAPQPGSAPTFGTPKRGIDSLEPRPCGTNNRSYAPQLWQEIVEDVGTFSASDLFFAGGELKLKVSGDLVPYIPSLENDQSRGMSRDLYDGLLDTLFQGQERLREAMQGNPLKALDFAATLMKMRFRVNMGMSHHGRFAVLRPLADSIPLYSDLGLTRELVEAIGGKTKGLFLVVGTTNSGKSTTLASILDYINERFPYAIITIEDPIEILFRNKRSTFIQREVKQHTASFHDGLRDGMRESPKIIFIGEIRDYETAKTALEAAETGHIVFGTMHTDRASGTISRIVEMAPHGAATEIRSLLARSLECVIAQALLPKRGGGRVAVREVMMRNHAIAAAIMAGKDNEIDNQLTMGRAQGMFQFQQSLERLEGVIDPKAFAMYSNKKAA